MKLRYSQKGLKKAQRGPDWLNHCFGSSKALVPWLCHTLQVKHEAGGGGLLRRGLPTRDVFCVQAVIALAKFPLGWGWGGSAVCVHVGGKVGSVALLADLLYLCLSGILRILF